MENALHVCISIISRNYGGLFNMETRINDLCLRLSNKGFLLIEIPDLIKDFYYLIENGRYSTMSSIDQELEDLGWGIGVMDNATYELTTSLVKNTGFSYVERHIRR
jgi:hypothetical protein